MKIRCRKNLLYLLIYYISAFIVSIIGNAIEYKYEFNPLYACIYLYLLENILGGLVVYLYHYGSARKKEKIKYFGIELIYNKKKLLMIEKKNIVNFFCIIF